MCAIDVPTISSSSLVIHIIYSGVVRKVTLLIARSGYFRLLSAAHVRRTVDNERRGVKKKDEKNKKAATTGDAFTGKGLVQSHRFRCVFPLGW